MALGSSGFLIGYFGDMEEETVMLHVVVVVIFTEVGVRLVVRQQGGRNVNSKMIHLLASGHDKRAVPGHDNNVFL